MISASWPTLGQMFALSDEELAGVDPVVMNLVIAKGIPSLADLNIGHYVQLANTWAEEIRQCLPAGETNFHRRPQLWQNDIDFARLAVMCWYVGEKLRIRYRKDQRKIVRVSYTNPGDLFLNGVMDDRQGTCGNMALLHVALGWRLGWPVSLACVGAHFICRFDDGQKVFNIEATNPGEDGTFSSPQDEYYRQEYKLPQCAVDCGSDLRAVKSRELMGLFVGARARHYENTSRYAEAESDYLLARHLFPTNRKLYIAQNQNSVQQSMDLFEPGEKGHPIELAQWLQEVVQVAPWNRKPVKQAQKAQEKTNGRHIDAIFEQVFVGADYR
jgi:hypothetical protein